MEVRNRENELVPFFSQVVDPDGLKWKDFVMPGVKIPTPWEKEEESERLSREHVNKVDAYLANSRFKDVVDAFEGAGYSAQSLYRQMLDCLMFTRGDKP